MRESQHKRLTRSGSDKMVAGVFGGIGQYFKIQPNILRILYVLLTIFTGFVPGVIIYIILVIIMPADPQNPDLLGILKSFSESQTKSHQSQERSRRTLTDVEEKDIKRNGRS
ncbi:PspC domain-containing protein [Lactobacillus sp. 0.1XD8-4]|uniref:PspC domain-containing protein n=1 Tax=uncultured Limosilactobacillus sp. TaxID=2837629 RepID=UPI00129DE470|nr:PspC domain-containing protein [uncultured Limosilactobacillus sp.]MRN06500.1 PspC domain-containing protein [Lactobacillus sp. 0.1XD8-4]